MITVHADVINQDSNSFPVGSAVILAGGLGTRLNQVVQDRPKPMALINGRPFLEYLMDYWAGQGIGHFILSVGYRREMIMDHFKDTYRNAQIDYAIEETPKGTGGGLLLATRKLAGNKTFLLLNGDTFFKVNLAELRAVHTACQSDWTFSLFRPDESGRYMGMEVDATGRIISLRSGSGRPGQPANGGAYLVEPDILRSISWHADQALSVEDDILPALLNAGGRMYGHVSNGRFIDIGVPADYFRAAEFLS